MRNLLNIILTILKASSWGFLLFLIICFVILEAWMVYQNASSIKPLSVVNEASNTMTIINSNLSKLEEFSPPTRSQTWSLEAAYDKLVLNRPESISEKKYREYTEMRTEVIRAALENDCPSCGLLYSWDSDTNTDYLKKRLERLSIKKNIVTFNIIKYLSLLISSIAILFGIYLVSVLFKYKKITARGVVFVMLLAVPIILTLIALPIVPTDRGFNEYLEFSSVSNDAVEVFFVLLGIAIGYFFLVYPPIFLICENKKISIKKALFLQRCCHAPSDSKQSEEIIGTGSN